MKRYLSWQDIKNQVEAIALKTTERPRTIIAIGNGGDVPGTLLANRLEVSDLQHVRAKSFGADGKRHGVNIFYTKLRSLGYDLDRVWVVDDIKDSGETMKKVSEFVQESSAPSAVGQVKTVALYWRASLCAPPSLYGEALRGSEWLVFPWEWERPQTTGEVKVAG